jgi:hypothetical protein
MVTDSPGDRGHAPGSEPRPSQESETTLPPIAIETSPTVKDYRVIAIVYSWRLARMLLPVAFVTVTLLLAADASGNSLLGWMEVGAFFIAGAVLVSMLWSWCRYPSDTWQKLNKRYPARYEIDDTGIVEGYAGLAGDKPTTPTQKPWGEYRKYLVLKNYFVVINHDRGYLLIPFRDMAPGIRPDVEALLKRHLPRARLP